MMTRKLYRALKPYECDIPVKSQRDGLSSADAELLKTGHIRSYETTGNTYGNVVTVNHPVSFIITDKGRKALSEYRSIRRNKIIHSILGYILGILTGVAVNYISNLIF